MMRTGGMAGLLRRGLAAGARRGVSSAAAVRSGGAVHVHFASQREPAAGAAAAAAAFDAPQRGAAARLVHHEGRCFFTMPMMERAVPHPAALLQPGATWDWRGPKLDDRAATGEEAERLIGYGELEGMLASIDLDGEVAWEELQAGSVMKKRKKAMNKHKWKKRRKRDRNYDR